MKFKNHQFYNCAITLDDTQQYNVDANWLHNEQLDNWKNWNCDAGYNRIYINSDLAVYSGECCNDYLGNLHNMWDILPTSSVCKRDRCSGCTDDLLVKKVK